MLLFLARRCGRSIVRFVVVASRAGVCFLAPYLFVVAYLHLRLPILLSNLRVRAGLVLFDASVWGLFPSRPIRLFRVCDPPVPIRIVPPCSFPEGRLTSPFSALFVLEGLPSPFPRRSSRWLMFCLMLFTGSLFPFNLTSLFVPLVHSVHPLLLRCRALAVPFFHVVCFSGLPSLFRSVPFPQWVAALCSAWRLPVPSRLFRGGCGLLVPSRLFRGVTVPYSDPFVPRGGCPLFLSVCSQEVAVPLCRSVCWEGLSSPFPLRLFQGGGCLLLPLRLFRGGCRPLLLICLLRGGYSVLAARLFILLSVSSVRAC